MATRTAEYQARIDKVLESAEWTAAEKSVVKWQFGLYGHFYTKLFDCLMSADDVNLERLALAFPDEVQGFLMWRDEKDMANKIDEAIGL